MTTNTLLIELGTEELPPKALKKLSAAFSEEILAGLTDAELINATQADNATSYATPRRLAISIPAVITAQADQTIERRGPAVQAAFKDDGEPTPAAQGFAKSCGVDVADLQRLKTDKGEWLSYNVEEAGKTLAELVPGIIDQAIKHLPIPKRMRWGAGDAEFVRPVHWLITLYGDTVLPCRILGIESSNKSYGHRFHSSGEIVVGHADHYEQILEQQGHVIANHKTRQAMIQKQVEKACQQASGVYELDQDLLDEVTGLVEYPSAVLGSFDRSFLDVPQECLIYSMSDHQKYFHIKDEQGALLPNFITISNIESKDPERVREGNERVLRARLSDAQFFWLTDQKTPLESRIKQLDNVLFHIKLGSIGDKSKRLQSLAKKIGKNINADPKITERGAALAKADLVTDMVGEFDQLQGTMGKYYAQIDGEDATVATCIEQHYWPKFAGDKLPESNAAQAVALADRLDSLVGIYGAGEVPTGDKDPYALRRASLSILRILIEQEHDLNLSELVKLSADVYQQQGIDIDTETQQQIVSFIRGRLTAHYQSQKIPTATINAVMACKPDSPLDFEHRIKAVADFEKVNESTDLAAANKRISNILKKQSGIINSDVDQSVLVEPAEQELHKAIEAIEQDCITLFDNGDYSQGLQKLANLRTPIDNFFEHVMVMSDDPRQQQNRLSLLKKMQQLFLRVADISLLQSQI